MTDNNEKVIPNVDSKSKEERNVPDLRFDNFTDVWALKRINEICEVNPKTKSLPEVFNYIDLESVKNGELIKNNTINIKNAPSRAQRLLKKGDILFSCVRPYQHNNYIYSDDVISVASTGFACLRTEISSDFLYEVINTNNFENKVMEKCTGTSYPAINSNDLGNIKVYIPSVYEELKIGNFMSLINNRILTQKKIIEDYKALKKQIINTIYDNNSYNSKLSNLIIQVSKRNKNSINNNVLSVSNKYGFIKQSEQFEDREVASDDISNYKIISKDIFAYNPARINVGSIAKYNNEDEGIVSPMYICFETNDTLLPEYLNYYFDSNEFKYQMSKRLEGSVRQCLTFESLENIPFNLPTMIEQKKNADIISTFNKKISFEEKYLRTLEFQKYYLLNKMFI